MSDNRYLDEFTDKLNDSQFIMDSKMKQKILGKTHRKIRRRWFSLKNIAAACLILVVISSFIPSTPVYALRQRLFSYIPGVGVVQNGEETGVIKSVLEKPVKVSEGDEFVEIRTAYLVDQTLNISIKTNIGAVDAGEFENVKEFKKFFAGETAPRIYLLNGSKKVEPGSMSCGGPSYETRIYTMNAGFYLGSESITNETFKFELAGFNKTIKLQMSPVQSDATPENIGNAASIDRVMVFADASRQGDVLKVLVSALAPTEYKNIRFHLYDFEKEEFKEGTHMVDKEGIVYEPDDELRKQNNDGRNTFYFNIPQDKKGLKLIVPQTLYDRDYNEGDIKINMPKADEEVLINKQINLGENLLVIEKAAIVPANDSMLPDNFKEINCLKIDASAKPMSDTRERISRVLPDIEVPDKIFSFIKPSSASYAGLWSFEQQKGYSITEFENMDKTKKILLNLDVECVMTGPWEIEID